MSSFTDQQGYLQPIADLHEEVDPELLDFGWVGVRVYRGVLENA